MANELLTPKLVAGATYYAVIYNEAGTVWNGSAFEAFTDANYATYPVSLTQLGTASGRYSATRPGGLSASTFYSYEVFRQPGGSPSLSADLLEAQGTLGPATVAAVTVAVGGIVSGAHAAAELNALADAYLDRNMATGTDSGTDSTVVRTVRQALRRLRNKEAIVTGTGTVSKEDDSTPSWTYAATATAGNPLSAIDPS